MCLASTGLVWPVDDVIFLILSLYISLSLSLFLRCPSQSQRQRLREWERILVNIIYNYYKNNQFLSQLDWVTNTIAGKRRQGTVYRVNGRYRMEANDRQFCQYLLLRRTKQTRQTLNRFILNEMIYQKLLLAFRIRRNRFLLFIYGECSNAAARSSK